MELTIYPYKLIKRTEYSKFKLFDIEENEFIENDTLLDKILSDYENQINNKDKFFKMNGDTLIALNDAVDLENIEFLFIPEYTITLEESALRNHRFKYVHIPDSVIQICPSAFSDCTKLTAVSIPNSVKFLSDNVFGICISLKYASLPPVESIPKSLFYGCSKLNTVIMPDTITRIGDYAFGMCESLKDIKLPKNLQTIGHDAFVDCTNLSNIEFFDKLTKIGEYAFCGCTALKELSLPDSVEEIARLAFFKCFRMETIKLPRNIKEIKENTFRECRSLSKIDFPDSIERLEGDIFRDVSELKNINIPEKLFGTDKESPFQHSSIESLTINHDLIESMITDNLIMNTKINKLIIDGCVSKIAAKPFSENNLQITSIDYLGTKRQFENFKENNKELFANLPNLQKINFLEKELQDPGREFLR